MTASSHTSLFTHSSHGIEACCFKRDTLNEVFATMLPERNEDVRSAVARMGRLVDELETDVVRMHAFGTIHAAPAFREALSAELGDVEWPVTYVDGSSCTGAQLAGVQFHAVSGAQKRYACL